MRVGVIGTGITGLTAAWLFQRAGAVVTVFDRQLRVGMDAHRVELEVEEQQVSVDIPPRMFSSSLWPNLTRLYRQIGVESIPIDPSKSFDRFQPVTDKPTVNSAVLKLGDTYQPKLTPGLILNPMTRQILSDIRRMMRSVPLDLQRENQVTMVEYLRENDYSEPFKCRFLYPALSSTVCTCSYDSLDAYPADVLLKAMLKLTEPEGLFRTRHGSRDVVERLTNDLSDIRLGTSVSRVEQTQSHAILHTDLGERLEFDHLIVATQANAAEKMLSPEMKTEKDMLSHFRYENISVAVHTDESLMPSRRKDWSHFNLLSSSDDRAAMCTIWMNRFCSDWQIDSPIFQTIMPLADPDPESLLGSAELQRPVVDQVSEIGLKKLAGLHAQNDRRVWFCGAYASPGVPLLESGVVSSLAVGERVGVGWPDPCAV